MHVCMILLPCSVWQRTRTTAAGKLSQYRLLLERPLQPCFQKRIPPEDKDHV